MSLSPEKCVFLKEKLYIFILASFFFFSFPFYLVNQPSSSLSSSPLSFSSLLRASAPASHQHQRPGSARRVKAGGGLSPTIYVCSFCARLYVCVWTWSPQTFMCLFFIISNNFAPPSLTLSGSSASRASPPWVLCAIMSSYLFFCHTQLHSRESSVDVIICDNGSEVQSPLPRPAPPYSV